jgi:hypothetical protein
VRGLSITLAATARDPDRLRRVAARVDALAAPSAHAAAGACAVVVVVAVGQLAGVLAAVAAGGGAVAGGSVRQMRRRVRRPVPARRAASPAPRQPASAG